MSMIYGVGSKEAANTRLTNGYDLMGWVMRKNGFPAYWGRSLSGRNAITTEEIEFLHGKYCKTALIFDDLTEAGVSKKNGTEDGQRAVEAAAALGVPAGRGIALFAAIREDWSVNHNWMISYARVLLKNGYIPGFMGNTDSSKNFNFDRQCSHYVQFMKETARDSTAWWATEPKIKGEPARWSPYCPSEMTPGQIDIWSSGGRIRYGDMIVVKKSYARNESVMRYMW